MNLTAYMVENVSGIGYQFYDASGLIGSRVTTGISNPTTGTYFAEGVSPPANAIGVRWTDATGFKEASEPLPHAPVGAGTPFDTCRRILEIRFTSLWDTGIFPVGQENLKLPEIGRAWGVFSVLQGQSASRAIGDTLVRCAGQIYLQAMVKRGAGSRHFTRAADLMTRIFNSLSLREGTTVIRTRHVGVQDVGNRDEYIQKNIICPFQRDHNP